MLNVMLILAVLFCIYFILLIVNMLMFGCTNHSTFCFCWLSYQTEKICKQDFIINIQFPSRREAVQFPSSFDRQCFFNCRCINLDFLVIVPAALGTATLHLPLGFGNLDGIALFQFTCECSSIIYPLYVLRLSVTLLFCPIL